MIAIDKISVRFGRVRAVDDLSLAIEKGESILLAGANGAGKTSLLRAMAGVLAPSIGLHSLRRPQSRPARAQEDRLYPGLDQPL